MVEKSPGERLLADAHLDEESLQIPASVVNKFRLLFASGNLRIAFAEGFSDRPNHYRSAVVMSALDALSLAHGILRAIPAGTNLLSPGGTYLGSAGIAGFGAATGTGIAGNFGQAPGQDSPLALREKKDG